MAVRTFTVNNSLTLAGGSSDLGTAGHSWVLLISPTSLGSFKDYIAARATATTVSGLFTTATTSALDLGADAGDSIAAALGITTGAWQIIGGSKASGATTATLHRTVLGTGTWTHTVGTGSYTTVTTALTDIIFGAADGAGSAIAGDIAVAALFLRALSNLEYESFVNKTSDIYNASGGIPTDLWEFNQASTATAVSDLVGSANQTALSGTSVNAGNTPTWTFDGIGTPAAAIPPLVMAPPIPT